MINFTSLISYSCSSIHDKRTSRYASASSLHKLFHIIAKAQSLYWRKISGELGTDEIIGEETSDNIQSGKGDTARRNTFLMLYNQNEDLAIEISANNMDDIGKYGYGCALLVLDLTRRVCRRDPNQKSRFVRVLLEICCLPILPLSPMKLLGHLPPSLLLPLPFAPLLSHTPVFSTGISIIILTSKRATAIVYMFYIF